MLKLVLGKKLKQDILTVCCTEYLESHLSSVFCSPTIYLRHTGRIWEFLM